MACLLILNVNALIFYEQKGASLLMISFFTSLTRCIELFLKPIIAFNSDNSNYKMGRRKPFMLFGCAFYCIFLIMIFNPPNNANKLNTSLYFGIFYILFFVADTITTIPYSGLGPELSTNTLERESLYLYVYIFQYIGLLITSLSPIIIKKFLKSCNCDELCFGITNIIELDQCIDNCDSKCLVHKTQNGLLYTCMYVGFIFVLFIILLSSMIKERKDIKNLKEKSYIIPTLYRIYNNKPFIDMLIPYILDLTITQIFATMLPFFIEYIINPRKNCEIKGIDLSDIQCDSQNWLGITMFLFFITSLFGLFLWHNLVNYIGKKNGWRSYSACCIVVVSLLLFCGSNNGVLLVFIACIIAIPASGGYINDAILCDTIDYDEFMTLKRNEGIYEVFSVFIPKIVGIAAQSIPLAIMNFLDFVPSKNGVFFEQPNKVLEFIKFYSIGVPVLLSLISFYLKTFYPITEAKMKKLTYDIKLQHIYFEKMKDKVNYYYITNPIYEIKQLQVNSLTDIQKDTQFLAEHFYNEEYLNDLVKGNTHAVYKAKLCIIGVWGGICLACFILLCITFQYLEDNNLSLFPIFFIILMTIGFALILLNVIQIFVLKKYMNLEKLYDKEFLKIFIHKIKLNKKENELKEGLFFEIKDLYNKIKNKNNNNNDKND